MHPLPLAVFALLTELRCYLAVVTEFLIPVFRNQPYK